MKGGHLMDSIANMNKALAYIEKHLESEIDYAEIEKLTICSEYHFKKMFSFLAGISLSEYIRRRRLTLAAIELKNSQVRVIDIAIKYGYSSNDAFTRAFHALHGVLPSEMRKESQPIKMFPKMSFQLTINGGQEMNCRIIEKEAFSIIGLKKRVPMVFHGVNPEIAKMAQLLTPEIIAQLKELSNTEPTGIISASTNFSEDRMDENGELDHYIGVATSNDRVEGFEKLKVEAGLWAIFESIGPFPQTLQETWGRIYSEWFPSNDFESIVGPEIVWHESKDMSNPMYRSEIWIPIRKK
jgi:AraC family transcriptional regulator